MAGSIRSPLLPLGISAPSGSKAGFRTAAGIWFGGASAPNRTKAGFRDLCGIWFGGASAPVVVPPIPPTPAGGAGGGWLGMRFEHKTKRKPGVDYGPEEQELMEILAIILPEIL